MSGIDENDFAKNGHSSDPTVLQSIQLPDTHMNGDDAKATKSSDNSNSKINSNSTTNDANTNESTTNELNATSASSTVKPTTPSNWVKFENEDDAAGDHAVSIIFHV